MNFGSLNGAKAFFRLNLVEISWLASLRVRALAKARSSELRNHAVAASAGSHQYEARPTMTVNPPSIKKSHFQPATHQGGRWN